MKPEELFGTNASQVDMIAMLLDSFPGQRDGVLVPIHTKSRRPWAERLYARGLRLHPELMTEFPVPGDHPEAGPLNPTKWLKKKEFAEHQAKRPTPAQAQQQLRQMLRAVDPGQLARIDAMTEDEKQQEAAQLAPHVGDFMRLLTQMREQVAATETPPPADQSGSNTDPA